jgi:hypothetical protein
VLSLVAGAGGGLLEGDPTQVAGAIAQQGAALLQNTAAGVLDSASRVSSTAAKGIKALDITQKRTAPGATGAVAPGHALEGFLAGGRTFSGSLLASVAGVVRDPIVGARQGGVLGAVKGVGSGVIGLVTKPTAGAFDGIALLLQGVSASVDPAKGSAPRARLPRYLGPDGRLMPFSAREAEGHARMALLAAAYPAKAGRQRYVYHCDVWEAVALPSDALFEPSALAASTGGLLAAAAAAASAGGGGGVELDAGLGGSTGPQERLLAAEQRLLRDYIASRGADARLEPVVTAGGAGEDEPVQAPLEEHAAAGGKGTVVADEEAGSVGVGGGGVPRRAPSLRSFASRPESILSLPVSERARKGVDVASGARRRLPRFLRSRQPDLIRAAERAKSSSPATRGGGAGSSAGGGGPPPLAPYVLLVTDAAVWLLEARTNRKLWAAGVPQASLAFKRNQAAARRIAEAAAAPAPALSTAGVGGTTTTLPPPPPPRPLVSFLATGPTITLASHELRKVRVR